MAGIKINSLYTRTAQVINFGGIMLEIWQELDTIKCG